MDEICIGGSDNESSIVCFILLHEYEKSNRKDKSVKKKI